MPPPMRRAGLSVRGNEYGSTFWPTLASPWRCGAAWSPARARRRCQSRPKKQFGVEVPLPILPVLAETLAAGPCGDLAFICGERGEPLTKESFGNLFKDACKAAGVPGSAHGVRKIAATRMRQCGRD